MEQSIRNQLAGTVKSIVSDKVLSEVIVDTSIGEIASIITTRSVLEMKLKPGDKVLALVKATTFPSVGRRCHARRRNLCSVTHNFLCPSLFGLALHPAFGF